MDIHTLCVPLNQRIRALNRAKSAGFMPRDGGLQCTDVRIPDSLSVRRTSLLARGRLGQREDEVAASCARLIGPLTIVLPIRPNAVQEP